MNEMEDALAEYASMMADSPENAEAAAAYAKERAEKLGADVAVASGTNAAAIGDTSAFIDDVAPLDAETDGAPDDKTLWAVPLLPYQTILTAEGIFTDEASAAHAMAAPMLLASLIPRSSIQPSVTARTKGAASDSPTTQAPEPVTVH